MSLNINKNFGALSGGALTALNAHQSEMGKSITRVSTGMRVNSPADDASAYLTSRRIKSDSDGYTALYNGLQSGSAKLNAVDSAVSSVLDVLNAMRSKALEYQALDKNDTDAVNAVTQEYNNLNKVLNSTVNYQYNGENVLGGAQNMTFYSAMTDDVDITASQYSSNVAKLSSTGSDTNYIKNADGEVIGAYSGASTGGSFKYGGVEYFVAKSDDGLDSNTNLFVFDDIEASGAGVSSAVGIINNSGVSWFASLKNDKVGGTLYTLKFDGGTSGVTVSDTGAYVGIVKSDSEVVLGGTAYKLDGFSGTSKNGTSNTAGVVLNAAGDAVGNYSFNKKNGELKVNIDPEAGAISVSWDNISSKVNSLSDITDEDIVKNIKTAIENVTKEQAKIASGMGAMEYASSYLQNAANAQSTAYTSITEADMAKEMTNYVKNNVYAQAAQAMIAQANQSLAQVLNLLQ